MSDSAPVSGRGSVGLVARHELLAPGVTQGKSGCERPARRFRTALEQVGGEVTEGAAQAAALAGWFRAEATLNPERAEAGPPPGSRARTVDRLLMGGGGEGTEARIRLGAGALAGAEIRLACLPGQPGIEAQILTCIAGSRETLAVAMNEVRLRLRAKGIVLSARLAGRPPGQPAAAGAGLNARTDR